MSLDDSGELADAFLGAAGGSGFLDRLTRIWPTDDRAPQPFNKEPNVRGYEPEFVDPAR
jgi:hypothetical protein